MILWLKNIFLTIVGLSNISQFKKKFLSDEDLSLHFVTNDLIQYYNEIFGLCNYHKQIFIYWMNKWLIHLHIKWHFLTNNVVWLFLHILIDWGFGLSRLLRHQLKLNSITMQHLWSFTEKKFNAIILSYFRYFSFIFIYFKIIIQFIRHKYILHNIKFFVI